jgi:hypothetical protein
MKKRLFIRNKHGHLVDRMSGCLTDMEFLRLERTATHEASVSQLWELAQHHHYVIRQAVAQNLNTPLEILEQLISDSNSEVVRQALKHPHATLDLLNKSPEFHKAKNWRLRVMIARDARTSLDVLLQLAEDDSAFVRYAVSRNPHTPQDVAEQAGDSNYFQQLLQAGIAGNDLKQLERLSTSYSVKLRKAVAYNQNTPRRIMEILVTDSSYQVRRELARNHKTPQHLLETLANDRRSCVRISVAANPTTPRDIKIRLCEDTDRRVQQVALRYTYLRPQW